MKHYSARKRNAILICVIPWMSLENIPSAISQTHTHMLARHHELGVGNCSLPHPQTGCDCVDRGHA